MKMICQYLQGTKDNCIVFNTYKKLVVDCYSAAYFGGLWRNENPQYPIFLGVELDLWQLFYNCPLL